ncbi:MAG: hypothetical protein JNL54_15145 [Kineosporiaceae bacterium]|nr:hypothetical protein [Kineosporiaceae bacterium]
MSLLDVLRPAGVIRIGTPRRPLDEDTGLPGRTAFTADLTRATRAHPPGLLCLGLLALGGLDQATLATGRRWVEQRVLCAGDVLSRLTACDTQLSAYRLGAHTFGLVLSATRLDDAFPIADAVRLRVERDADPLTCAIGLAIMDDVRVTDPAALEIAADAALDQAQLLGRDGGTGRVVAAADEASGLRWITTRPGR